MEVMRKGVGAAWYQGKRWELAKAYRELIKLSELMEVMRKRIGAAWYGAAACAGPSAHGTLAGPTRLAAIHTQAARRQSPACDRQVRCVTPSREACVPSLQCQLSEASHARLQPDQLRLVCAWKAGTLRLVPRSFLANHGRNANPTCIHDLAWSYRHRLLGRGMSIGQQTL